MRIVPQSIEILTPIDGVYICRFIEMCARNCYKSEGNITEDSYKAMIEKLIQSGHTAMLEHFNITVKLVTNVGCYKDLTRHRCASYAIESTRWCNYNKGKFGSEITVTDPIHIDHNSEAYQIWLETMQTIENNYNKMAALGCKPDQLRLLLPHSTKGDMIITANIREWRHIFSLRCKKEAHPEVQYVMGLVLKEFKQKIPLLFDDIIADADLEAQNP